MTEPYLQRYGSAMIPHFPTPGPTRTAGSRPHFTKTVILGAEKDLKGDWKRQMMCTVCFELDPTGDCEGIPEGFSTAPYTGVY